MSPDDLDTQPYLESAVPSPGPTPHKVQSFEDVETKRRKYQGNPKLTSTVELCPETPNPAPTSSHDSKGDHDASEPVEKATPAPTVEPEADLEKKDHTEVLDSKNTI